MRNVSIMTKSELHRGVCSCQCVRNADKITDILKIKQL